MPLPGRLLVAILLLAAACAGSPRQSSSSTSNLITRGELDAVGSVSTYEAVQRLRPSFLRVRGPVSIMVASARPRPVVFVDATEYGEVESLRSFPAGRVEEVRFFPGVEAATKFGSIYGAGVIQLRMRTQ